MEDYLSKITPWLDKIREFIMGGAEIIARTFEWKADSVYLILLVLISWFVGKKIFNFFYADTQGRTGVLLIIIAILFGTLKFLGV